MEYTVGAPEEKCDSRVVDLYPSASAVNIDNNKYKDSNWGLAFLASFFSWGFNAAYNHDHLQISQSLGQSALITGTGIGKQQFGWAFGRNLGDDMVSPGTRTVFALLATTCDKIKIDPTKAGGGTAKMPMIGPMVVTRNNSSWIPAIKSAQPSL